ncbi:MAG: aspartate aminotransferase family protein, partial [Spirochaetia bacterium]|nr:aspartate aminotransferase family protein [Spirochaetia bacterium]
MSKYSLIPQEVEKVLTKFRTIKTQIPSPSSVPLLQEMLEYEPISMQGQPPIIIDRAEGFQVYDESENMWLDFSSGVLINNIGHGDSHITKALTEVINKPLLSTYVFPHRARITLSKMLCETVKFPNYKVFLLSTGSEATENCIKLAKTYGLKKYGSHKKYFISFDNAFHGRTLGAQLAGGMAKGKTWIGELDPTFVQVPFPDGYRTEDLSFDLFLKTLEKKGIKGEDVCGVMSESYQGVGPHFFPKEYAKSLEAWCKKFDAVLIMDEVQAGFCRTGKWYTYEHYDIQPDLIACGKGISGALPLSAVIGRDELMNQYAPGSMTSTHSGSPLPVVSAIANITELKKGKHLENARTLGPILTASLEK